MKVLALVTDAYGGRGGIAKAARDVVAAMAAIPEINAINILPRHAVHAPTGLPDRVRQQEARPGRWTYAATSLAATVTLKPNIVFCNHLFMAPLAHRTARVAGAKFAIQLHGIEIWSKPSYAQRAALEAADLIICVSRDTRSRALAHANIAPERACVVNNTVDPRFTPGDRAAARRKFDLGNEVVLLAVGRLDPRERYKGQDRVINALPRLLGPEGRPVIFLIAGDGEDRERLEEVAKSADVARHVRFLGQVPDSDLPNLYRAADLFVLPSTGEGFGIVFLEAMACGTPSIGLAVGGAPDALGDGELGKLVRPEADLAHALQKEIDMPRPDELALAAAVRARFGTATFRNRLAFALAGIINRQ